MYYCTYYTWEKIKCTFFTSSQDFQYFIDFLKCKKLAEERPAHISFFSIILTVKSLPTCVRKLVRNALLTGTLIQTVACCETTNRNI